jgi:enamine deaminase RidA (YjgF/YER057c/UK114 family)
MAKRQSINGEKSRHENPIPNASRVGPLIMSSVITGRDPNTKRMPDSLEEQVTNCFAYIRGDVEAAGASVDDIVKITFWLSDPATQRPGLNAEWLRMFPDPASRPARHTLTLPPGSHGQVQANFVAFVS